MPVDDHIESPANQSHVNNELFHEPPCAEYTLGFDDIDTHGANHRLFQLVVAVIYGFSPLGDIAVSAENLNVSGNVVATPRNRNYMITLQVLG